MCIRYLELLNENKIIGEEKDNIFYGKIDLDHVVLWVILREALAY
ncbi:hypothetical protein [Ruminococcus sp.]|nr:hypothetical protein [Ruminococcus sp.]